MAFQPAPTWASPVLTDDRTKISNFNPIWLKWFVDLTGILNTIGSGGTSINHNGLRGLQGGGANEFYHFSAAQAGLFSASPIGQVLSGTGGLPAWTASLSVTSLTVSGAVQGATVKATAVGGYKSSDGSAGFTGTITTASLVGKTITIKDGLITGFA